MPPIALSGLLPTTSKPLGAVQSGCLLQACYNKSFTFPQTCPFPELLWINGFHQEDITTLTWWWWHDSQLVLWLPESSMERARKARHRAAQHRRDSQHIVTSLMLASMMMLLNLIPLICRCIIHVLDVVGIQKMSNSSLYYYVWNTFPVSENLGCISAVCQRFQEAEAQCGSGVLLSLELTLLPWSWICQVGSWTGNQDFFLNDLGDNLWTLVETALDQSITHQLHWPGN